MFTLRKPLLGLFGMLCVFAAASPKVAFADDTSRCDPQKFQNVSFRNMHDITKYAFLSSLTETEFKQHQSQIEAEIVIPFLDIPLGGSYAEMQDQLRQVQRLTQINLATDTTATLLDITWSEIGAQAYRACVNALHQDEYLSIEYLRGTDPFENELVIELKWQTRQSSPPKTVDSIFCIGCSSYDGVKRGDKLQQGNAVPVKITRQPQKSLGFIISVNGLTAQFHLPKPPVELKKPEMRVWTQGIAATDKVSSGQLHPPQMTFCYPPPTLTEAEKAPLAPTSAASKVILGPGEEFLVKTAFGRKTSEGGTYGYAREPSLTTNLPTLLCWYFEVVSYDEHNGYSAAYVLGAEVVGPVTSPNKIQQSSVTPKLMMRHRRYSTLKTPVSIVRAGEPACECHTPDENGNDEVYKCGERACLLDSLFIDICVDGEWKPTGVRCD